MMSTKPCLAIVFGLACVAAFAAEPNRTTAIVPLFDTHTKLEAAVTVETPSALVTRVADRVRDRHARENAFKAYDHYLSWYWEERTVVIELVDRVAKGGSDVTVNITSLAPLSTPDFRCFFRGINTVAEYHYNIATKEVAPHRYSTTISYNPRQRRELKVGDRMEFEFSPFLVAPRNGRKNYYGTAMLYVVGRGIVPWQAAGQDRDSVPLPEIAWIGGRTTLSHNYSDEPRERFKQMATNVSAASAQSFMQGRRLHHTDFGNGQHSEQPNPVYDQQAGKLGPQFVARSCIACHVNNGRALPPATGAPMYQTVVKVGADAQGSPHSQLGTALQPQATIGEPEAMVRLSGYTTIQGAFADGSEYRLRKPTYAFEGASPQYFSVRLAPQLVGLGLLEAVRESDIIALADPDDDDKDGISGRVQTVDDPETGQVRLGRFGYKAGQARLSHQIAAALNSDIGVTTSVFPMLDQSTEGEAKGPEVSSADLANMTRYIATLGVSARRGSSDEETLRGEQLFQRANCAKCHTPNWITSPYHPFAELRSQTIHPYTDLLLHDMGPGLADNLGEHAANGAEWRTPPLWNIGLTSGVRGGEAYLHDGRARNLEEAILWHGGEAAASKDLFRTMPAADRAALVGFLQSL